MVLWPRRRAYFTSFTRRTRFPGPSLQHPGVAVSPRRRAILNNKSSVEGRKARGSSSSSGSNHFLLLKPPMQLVYSSVLAGSNTCEANALECGSAEWRVATKLAVSSYLLVGTSY